MSQENMRKILLEKHSIQELKNMSIEELKIICKKGRCSYKIPLVRVIAELGIDVSSIYKEQSIYDNFTKLYKDFGLSGNMVNFYLKYYQPLLEHVDFPNFKVWLLENYSQTSQYNNIIKCLSMIDPKHPYINIVKDRNTMTFEQSTTWEKYKKLNRVINKNGARVVCQKYDNTAAINTTQFIRCYLLWDKTEDSYDKILEFCKDTTHGGYILPYKVQFLECIGNKWINDIIKDMYRINASIQYRKDITKGIGMSRCNIAWYDEIEDIFGSLNNIHKLGEDDIVKGILTSKRRKFTFRVVSYILGDINIVNKLISIFDYSITGVKTVDKFRTNEWRHVLIKNITDKYKSVITNTSTYPESYLKILEYKISKILLFTEYHTLKEEYVIGNEDPIKWFLTNCNKSMILKLIFDLGKSQNSCNERVKSVNYDHHAKKIVSFAISLFRNYLIDYIECSDCLHDINPSYFTNRIENHRIPYDQSVRRTYTDDEVLEMLKLTESDPRLVLLLTILWEIGLRAGAICNIQYKDLYLGSIPKHTCIVLEKGKKYREFITSKTLKLKLVTFRQYLIETNPDIENIDEIFVFNGRNIYEPLPQTTLGAILKRVAKDAGVQVNVHPHAFRHTIVGKLMDAGNNVELVSKFIGHENVNTTIKHYWLKSIEDLCKEIKNPFMNIYKTEEEEKKDYIDELERANTKIDASLGILHIYNQELDMSMQNGDSAITFSNKIHNRIPNLRKLLLNIADSINGSDTTSIKEFI